MKFIGGSRHGLEVPMSVQMAIHAQRRRWIDVDPPGAAHPAPALMSGWAHGTARERYHVVMCRAGDGGTSPMLVRAGMGRDALRVITSAAGVRLVDVGGPPRP